MKLNSPVILALIALYTMLATQTAQAGTQGYATELPPLAANYGYGWTAPNDTRLGHTQPYMLALNESNIAGGKSAGSGPGSAEFEPPLFTSSNAHKYLGLGTVLFAGLTAMTAPEEGCEHNCPPNPPPRQTSGTTHTRLARTTAVLAVATLTSGLLAHWDDFHLEDGITDPDNQHVLLGTTGALMMLYAIHKSANSSTQTSHAGIAELGGIAMAVAIKLTW